MNKNQKLEPRFCYRISANAGLAHDGEGNNAPCFTQANFEGGNLLRKVDYDSAHEKLKIDLSKQLNIPIEYFECISQEEFDKNHQDD
ncbi:hypothetical protein [Metasolibacillus sp.]|uniref:hypothetical protein n=1 Tax=Metasolibacillus sp. TaxID=2703680 RepID=UPI0025E85759|nr:hypothetical protein [Metasolibacillus sp.]MCT6922794.1 hypothetical protein [Metasolibacillus sp.]MCT6938867.1 hypothetical protein [Metasolibacillus sp.]